MKDKLMKTFKKLFFFTIKLEEHPETWPGQRSWRTNAWIWIWAAPAVLSKLQPLHPQSSSIFDLSYISACYYTCACVCVCVCVFVCIALSGVLYSGEGGVCVCVCVCVCVRVNICEWIYASELKPSYWLTGTRTSYRIVADAYCTHVWISSLNGSSQSSMYSLSQYRPPFNFSLFIFPSSLFSRPSLSLSFFSLPKSFFFLLKEFWNFSFLLERSPANNA